VVPLIVLLAAGSFWMTPDIHNELSAPEAMAGPQTARPLLLGAIWVPEALLSLWIIWVVSTAFTRPGERRDDDALTSTPLPRRTVVLARTIAPTYPAIVVLVGLAALEARLAAIWGGESLLYRLGHIAWVEALRPFEITGPWGPPKTLLILELPARMLLFGVALASLTAWAAARAHSPLRAAGTTLAVCAAIFLLALATDWIVYDRLLPWDQFFLHSDTMEPARIRTAHQIILIELAYDLSARFLIPLLWLAWWWRWANRGYAEVRRQDR
jgi:hypothetical protein